MTRYPFTYYITVSGREIAEVDGVAEIYRNPEHPDDIIVNEIAIDCLDDGGDFVLQPKTDPLFHQIEDWLRAERMDCLRGAIDDERLSA